MRSSGQIKLLERNFLNVKQVGSQEPWEADQGWVLGVRCSGKHFGQNVLQAHPSCVASTEHIGTKMRDQGEAQMAGQSSEQLGDDSPVKFIKGFTHVGLTGTD